MQILKVTDEAFRQYGKVIKDLDASDIITAMSETPCPDDVVSGGWLRRLQWWFRPGLRRPPFWMSRRCGLR